MERPTWANYGIGDQSKYPELWSGCEYAAAPCLGPTGGWLRDLSAYNSLGELYSMDPATDWVLSGGSYSLDFDGTNDGVYVYRSWPSYDDLTISLWFYLRSTADTQSFIGWTGGAYMDVAAGPQISCTVRGSTAATANISTNIWTHAVLRRTGSVVRVFINGSSSGSSDGSGSSSTFTTTQIGLGGGNAGDRRSDCRLDDIRIYRRGLSDSEIKQLSEYRGVAYEPRSTRRYFYQTNTVVQSTSSSSSSLSSVSSASSASSASSMSSASSISTSSSSRSSISTSSSSGVGAATGYQQANATSSVKTASAFSLPWWASHVEMQADTGPIRYTMDGSTPDVSNGFVLAALDEPEEFFIEDFINLKFTRGSGVDARLNVHFIPRSEP